MLFKIISANIRGSIPIWNVLRVTSGQSFPVIRSRLLQINTSYCATLQYSTEKTASSVAKSTDINKNEKLSREEIHMLNEDPDNFGTLSSFESPTLTELSEEPPQVKRRETKAERAAKRKLSYQKWTEQNEILLKQLIAEKGVQEAIQIFENQMLKIERVLPDVRIYEWLIDECLRFNIYDKAFQLYEQMMSRSLRVSLSTIEKLTTAYEVAGMNIQKAHTIRKIISKKQYKPNAVIYNSLIRIYIRANKYPISMELADEMKKCGFVYELDTLNLLLEYCTYDEDNGFIRMLELWHEMQQLNYTPNNHTLKAVLKTIHSCQINDIEKLKETVKSICAKYEEVSTDKTKDIVKKDFILDGRPNLLKNPPNIGHIFPLQNATTPDTRLLILGGLSEILTLIREHKILPTLEIITILLSLTPNTFVAQQKVLRLLKKYEIHPSMDIFNILLTKICMRQNFDDAQEIMEMMRTFEVETDLVTYGLFAMTCKTPEEANQFFYEAEKNNIEYDADILNGMLKNACAAQNNDFVISILRKMKSKGIEPLEESIDMIEAYQKQKFRDMRTKRVHDKRSRNECFKIVRECKEWIKHFQLDKRWINEIEPINTKKDRQSLKN